MKNLYKILSVALVFLLAGCGQSDQEKQVAEILTKVQAADEFKSHEEMSAESAASAEARLLQEAKEVTGENLDRDGLEKWQLLQNHGHTVNWVAIIAYLVGGIALILIFAIFFSNSVELLAGLSGIAGVIMLFAFDGTFWYLIPGCILSAIGTVYLVSKMSRPSQSSMTGACLGLALLWGAVAVQNDSTLIAVFSVLALEAALGFIAGVGLGFAWIGFDKEDAIPRATTASLALLVMGFCLEMGVGNANFLENFTVFKTALLSVGTFVYMLGLLIMSCRYYGSNRASAGRYLLMQVIMIVSGLAISMAGFSFGIDFFKGMAGFFLLFYLAEKYIEIPWREAWPIGLLGGAGFLWGCAKFMESYPELFVVGL